MAFVAIVGCALSIQLAWDNPAATPAGRIVDDVQTPGHIRIESSTTDPSSPMSLSDYFVSAERRSKAAHLGSIYYPAGILRSGFGRLRAFRFMTGATSLAAKMNAMIAGLANS
ncbi:hypothetical protein AAL_00028 [Moelleriella libera RCEF 2490]|uniref:Uncharacterized protein n=1 Tax=Moelleriella libera RCEF 2490 TaxID=1081109 RepID=A0A166UI62_9HYPO|nr:hypothetical protein AAL_00028 [Moelleriella libera RCEF 2490]